MADDLSPGLCTSFKRRKAIALETTLTWTKFEGLSVALILRVVRMITTSKDGFCDKSDAENFGTAEVGFQVDVVAA